MTKRTAADSAASFDVHDIAAAKSFIAQNTKRLAPPLVPEIVLHLAEESLPIWEKTEEELGELNVPPPFWAFAWAGGQALARYVLENTHLVRGKRVLDLGSGSGLTAIAAMKSGAQCALAADVDPLSAAAVDLNAAANDVAVSFTEEDLLTRVPENYGVVLVADLFYERQLADRVLRFIEDAFAAGALVLAGDPQRSYFPRDRFTLVQSYNVPVTRELEDATIKNTAVWRFPSSVAAH